MLQPNGLKPVTAVFDRCWVCLYFSWKCKISCEFGPAPREPLMLCVDLCVCATHFQHCRMSAPSLPLSSSLPSSVILLNTPCSISVCSKSLLLFYVSTDISGNIWISVTSLTEKRGHWRSRTCWKLSSHDYLRIGWYLVNLLISCLVLWLQYLNERPHDH